LKNYGSVYRRGSAGVCAQRCAAAERKHWPVWPTAGGTHLWRTNKPVGSRSSDSPAESSHGFLDSCGSSFTVYRLHYTHECTAGCGCVVTRSAEFRPFARLHCLHIRRLIRLTVRNGGCFAFYVLLKTNWKLQGLWFRRSYVLASGAGITTSVTAPPPPPQSSACIVMYQQ